MPVMQSTLLKGKRIRLGDVSAMFPLNFKIHCMRLSWRISKQTACGDVTSQSTTAPSQTCLLVSCRLFGLVRNAIVGVRRMSHSGICLCHYHGRNPAGSILDACQGRWMICSEPLQLLKSCKETKRRSVNVVDKSPQQQGESLCIDFQKYWSSTSSGSSIRKMEGRN